jgi:CheY-like chemotaxis protein
VTTKKRFGGWSVPPSTAAPTEIGEARDGDESVELARRLEPDLVVLDIMMPGRSGSRCSGSYDGTRVSARRRS